MQIEIEQVDYHRNGIRGQGFYVVTFLWTDPNGDENGDNEIRAMVGVLFGDWSKDETKYVCDGRCAVFDRGMLGDGNMTFGHNSWRGDRFESELVKAIEQYNNGEGKMTKCEVEG